jgi:hypothetical protein
MIPLIERTLHYLRIMLIVEAQPSLWINKSQSKGGAAKKGIQPEKQGFF